MATRDRTIENLIERLHRLPGVGPKTAERLAFHLMRVEADEAAGIPGVFLAIPLVALGVVIYRHIVEHKGSKGLVADMIESTTNSEEEAPSLVIKPGDPAPGL